MQGSVMPIKSRIKVLLAERNLERIKAGLEPISMRKVAQETGITNAALVNIANNRTTRVDFETVEKLMKFFETDDIRDILEYTSDEPSK